MASDEIKAAYAEMIESRKALGEVNTEIRRTKISRRPVTDDQWTRHRLATKEYDRAQIHYYEARGQTLELSDKAIRPSII